jgi:predicted  nucleic acid-binding Zn-ribbon protein
MGDRNHLHVCRHCGLVHATASSTGPEECIVCGAFTFSEYVPEPTDREGPETERRERLLE